MCNVSQGGGVTAHRWRAVLRRRTIAKGERLQPSLWIAMVSVGPVRYLAQRACLGKDARVFDVR